MICCKTHHIKERKEARRRPGQ